VIAGLVGQIAELVLRLFAYLTVLAMLPFMLVLAGLAALLAWLTPLTYDGAGIVVGVIFVIAFWGWLLSRVL
jgi:hypothetical protein